MERSPPMPRFVILEHDQPHLHWDLMLEDAGRLLTWRLARPPVSAEPVAAESIADHRIAYLDYEGPVSGNRGTVRQWDAGTFRWLDRSEDALRVALFGDACAGRLELLRGPAGWSARLDPSAGRLEGGAC